MDVEVTSANRKPQRAGDVAAAVFVITQEDIRRSGATSVPEVLRMAPGVEVARIDANKWAVTARGFNGGFANKLLVLLDGRSMYTRLFSGVFRDTLDTELADIDRIEIIRGPGAAVWGANAVNAETLTGDLRTAVGESDAEGIARAAHSLKSASYQLGAENLGAVCAELEALGRQGVTDGASSLVAEVDRLYPSVRAALEARLDRENLAHTVST